jgi:hypothetical protein
MQNQNHQTCLGSFDFISYMSGATYGCQKITIEQHLCDCDDCFQALIGVLNQHLNQADSLIAGSLPAAGRQAGLRWQAA